MLLVYVEHTLPALKFLSQQRMAGIFTLHKICVSTENGILQVRFLNKRAGTVLWRDIMFYFIGGTFFIEERDV
jgi:hypothetical protein